MLCVDSNSPSISPPSFRFLLYQRHRRCCHAAFDVNAEWACPFTAASESAIDLLGTEPIDDALDWVTVQEISKVYKTAESQESAVYNADGEARKYLR